MCCSISKKAKETLHVLAAGKIDKNVEVGGEIQTNTNTGSSSNSNYNRDVSGREMNVIKNIS